MSAAEQSIADVLDRAADLIEPEGAWTQEVYARGKSGREVFTARSATCFCAAGAVNVASGRNPGDDRCDAILVLNRVAGFDGIAEWNDAPGRTQAEVVAKLREAASLAREQGK